MYQPMRKGFVLCLSMLCIVMVGCRHVPVEPSEPDYDDTSMWYTAERGCDVDLFYITSTETDDYMHGGTVMHHADVTLDSIRALLLGEMQGIDHMYGDGFNFFSPYYRQCTLETYTSDSLLVARAPLAMDDVQSAFAYYLEHINGGRPFILMGFSQGGQWVVELLRTMDDETYSRMVVAYVVGWKVTNDDLVSARGHGQRRPRRHRLLQQRPLARMRHPYPQRRQPPGYQPRQLAHRWLAGHTGVQG